MMLAHYSMAIVFGLLAQADADALIKPNQNINQVSKRMAEAGYKETDLQRGAGSKQNELRFWDLDPGVLMVVYSKKSGEVFSVTYLLENEGPKSERWSVEFKVIEFNPVSREMKLKLPDKPKPKAEK